MALDDTEVLKRGQQDRKVRPVSMFEPTESPAASLRKNQSSEDLVRDAQVTALITIACGFVEFSITVEQFNRISKLVRVRGKKTWLHRHDQL